MFYGGKGGVGKTTCAAARSVVEALSGARVLVVSTDPAHSLGDALGVRLTSHPSRVALPDARSGARSAAAASKRARSAGARRPAGSLDAVEIDAARAFRRWLARHRQALAEILEHGTWLDADDIHALLELSLPGVDEVLGLLELVRLSTGDAGRRARRKPYDLVVVDTAPTGHTLRLLGAPETVAEAAAALDALQAEHRFIRSRISGRFTPDASDRLIALLAEQAEQATTLVTEPRRSTFSWVMLAEQLALDETADAVAALSRGGMTIAELIVNRILDTDSSCPICDPLLEEQRRIIADIPRRLGIAAPVTLVPERDVEPRGLERLIEVGRFLGGARRRDRLLRRSPRAGWRAASAFSGPEPKSRSAPPESIDELGSAHLLFFCGKGGVGKTTVAAAAALGLARADPKTPVLLLSTDPAHSLGDLLEPGEARTIGDRPARVPGGPKNLEVREVDAVGALAAKRRELEAALDEVPGALGVRGAAFLDQMMGLTPPGVDELLGIVSVVESRSSYGRIIVDAAPTGHALRLLQTPDAALEWVRALMRMMLKYRRIVHAGALGSALTALSRSIRGLQAALRDHRETHVVVVTRAAALPALETERLLKSLDRLNIAAPVLIVNALTMTPGSCGRCRRIAAAEAKEIVRISRVCRRRRSRCAIIQTPLCAPPPRGLSAVERWARSWVYGDGMRGGKRTSADDGRNARGRGGEL